MLGLVGLKQAVVAVVVMVVMVETVVVVATELFQNVFKPTERSSQYKVLYRSTN